MAATQFSEPAMARSDPRDQADRFSSHAIIPSRTAEENKESPLKSQVLMQVKHHMPLNSSPSNLVCHLKPKRNDAAGCRN